MRNLGLDYEFINALNASRKRRNKSGKFMVNIRISPTINKRFYVGDNVYVNVEKVISNYRQQNDFNKEFENKIELLRGVKCTVNAISNDGGFLDKGNGRYFTKDELSNTPLY